MVHDGPTGPRIQFGHFAGAQYLDAERRKHTRSWQGLFAQDDPLASVRSMEQAAGLDDEHTWQAVAVPLLAPDEVVEKSTDVLERWFPTAQTTASGYLGSDRPRRGESRWMSAARARCGSQRRS